MIIMLQCLIKLMLLMRCYKIITMEILKQHGKGNRNGKQNTTETKFEGLLKEENFKGVVIKYGKSAIQSRLLRLAATTHVNAKNQPFVVNLITFKEPITVKQFVNTRENPINP